MRSLLVVLIIAGTIACKKQTPPPPSPTAPMAKSPMPKVPTQAGALKFTTPKGWTRNPPSNRMRRAEFVLPGKAGAAQLIVFHFPGTGGDVKHNLKRWYRQFKQPDGKPSESRATTKDLTVNGLKVTTAYLTGSHLKSKAPMMMRGPKVEVKNQALLAAIVSTAGGPWFFKAVGPQATIDENRKKFDELVKSIRR